MTIVRHLKLHEGRFAGRPFPLQPWQERIIRRIYGDTREDGRRRIRTVFVLLPRGNGKTTLAAALAGLHLFGSEREPAGQVISAAADRDQASIAFKALSGMVRQDQSLLRRLSITPSSKRIYHSASRSEFKAISHEAATKHGMSVSCLIADEIHAWPSRELWDVLTTSMGKRDNPLAIVITTAGVGQLNLAFEMYEYAKKVAAGEVQDETFLPILFEAPADADWRDETVWRAVNPALASGFRSLEEMRITARQSESIPAQREAFKRLYLNMWSDGAADPWLDMTIWDEGAEAVDLDAREGDPVWLGVDLATTSDLTCVCAAFKDPDGGFSVWPFTFAPEGSLRRRQDRGEAPYVTWTEDGLMDATPGDVTDYAYVEAVIQDLARRFRVQEIAMDPWNATATINRLLEIGLPVVEHRQGFPSLSGPMKAVERAVLARKLRHGGHPVLRWCVANVVVDQDPAGNVKPNKGKAREKIDAAVAMMMAVGRADLGDGGMSVYEDERPEGLIFV